MDLELNGRAALVTGSSRGIGRAIGLGLVREGCRVAFSSRGGPDLDATVAEARRSADAAGNGGGAVGVVGDLSTAGGANQVARAAIEALGGLDILVNNVGGSGARTFEGCDEADLQDMLDRNLWPAHRVSRAVLPSMKQRGGGVIVMITSIWGREAGGSPGYNVAKAAELSLAKAMARDLARDHVRVLSVAPGSILFPGGGWDRRVQQDPAAMAAFVERELPFGRFGTPEEVADVVVFLCSARARWVAGACVPVDGAQGRAF